MIFYYFLPVSKDKLQVGDELDRDVLAEHGLADVLADVRRVPAHASVCGVSGNKGPGGQSGVIVAPVSKHRGVPGIVGNDPLRQAWRPRGKAWVGIATGAIPTPLDLERWKTIGGYKLEDPQHYEWQVPVARASWMEFGTLPQSYKFDERGEPVPNLQPEFVWLWTLAGLVHDWYLSQEPPEDATPAERAEHQPRPFAELVKAAARVLAVNYRVGLAELNFLHDLGRPVLTQQTVHAICQTLFGWEVLEEAKKKQPAAAEPAPASSSPSTTGAATRSASLGTPRAGAL